MSGTWPTPFQRTILGTKQKSLFCVSNVLNPDGSIWIRIDLAHLEPDPFGMMIYKNEIVQYGNLSPTFFAAT
jgi:hypothetical protein